MKANEITTKVCSVCGGPVTDLDEENQAGYCELDGIAQLKGVNYDQES